MIPFSLPSLRERKEDIPLLVNYFLQKIAIKNRSEKKEISNEGMKLLIEYHWPGNIRELQNLVERLYVISPGQ